MLIKTKRPTLTNKFLTPQVSRSTAFGQIRRSLGPPVRLPMTPNSLGTFASTRTPGSLGKPSRRLDLDAMKEKREEEEEVQEEEEKRNPMAIPRRSAAAIAEVSDKLFEQVSSTDEYSEIRRNDSTMLSLLLAPFLSLLQAGSKIPSPNPASQISYQPRRTQLLHLEPPSPNLKTIKNPMRRPKFQALPWMISKSVLIRCEGKAYNVALLAMLREDRL